MFCMLVLVSFVVKSVPVLGAVCPPLVTVIVLLLFHRRIRSRRIYQGAALAALASAVVIELSLYDALPFSLAWLPLYDVGFAWVPFAALGGVAGWAVGKARGVQVA